MTWPLREHCAILRKTIASDGDGGDGDGNDDDDDDDDGARYRWRSPKAASIGRLWLLIAFLTTRNCSGIILKNHFYTNWQVK